MKNITTMEKYILDLAAYDLEPLHIIVAALLSDKLCQKPREAVTCVVGLVEKGYLIVSVHSGKSGAEYKKIDELNQDELYADIEKRNQFETYPEGNEYFFKTSKEGMSVIEDMTQR